MGVASPPPVGWRVCAINSQELTGSQPARYPSPWLCRDDRNRTCVGPGPKPGGRPLPHIPKYPRMAPGAYRHALELSKCQARGPKPVQLARVVGESNPRDRAPSGRSSKPCSPCRRWRTSCRWALRSLGIGDQRPALGDDAEVLGLPGARQHGELGTAQVARRHPVGGHGRKDGLCQTEAQAFNAVEHLDGIEPPTRWVRTSRSTAELQVRCQAVDSNHVASLEGRAWQVSGRCYLP